MKTYTIKYDTKNKGISGTFEKSLPEPLDYAMSCINPDDFEDPAQADASAESLAESDAFLVLYWGWFRQMLVTYRAQAKRLREGNKTDAPMSASEVAKYMATVKLPTYGEPAEVKTDVQKAAESTLALSGDKLRKHLRTIGIPEDSIATMAAAIEAKQAK